MDHERFMRLALVEARAALCAGEVPVGCVIVRGDDIIGAGRNRCAERGSALCHAELLAIAEAVKSVGDYRLNMTALYVTIEPCPMCAGAIVMSRVGTVVYGAKNPKAGCAGSIYNLVEEPRFNHRAALFGGVLADECGSLMTEFFRRRKHG